MTALAETLEDVHGVPADGPRTKLTLLEKAKVLVSSAVAAVLGVLPHVLHHAGPLAGSALLAGAAGSLLFGAVGLLAAIPFLLHLHRRFGSWRVPAGALALMAVVFSFSAFVIGPAVNGDEGGSNTGGETGAPATSTKEPGHASHH